MKATRKKGSRDKGIEGSSVRSQALHPLVPLSLLMLGLILPTIAGAVLHQQTVEYRQGATVLSGYLAYDDSFAGLRPAVLVFHHWMGIDQYIKDRTDQLARMGYVAFAADIYGKGVRPTNSTEAGNLAGKYRNDRLLMRGRAQAALDTLRRMPHVDTKRIAAIGYCFGGGVALELARSGADIAGVVSFHGTLDTPHPEDAKNIKAKVLVMQGTDDPVAPLKQIGALEDEMRNGGVDYQIVLFGGAVHSFSMPMAGNDPKTGNAYNPEADRRSWQAMKDFFADVFGDR
jgi:dienelactone hydrolase